ncbi:MAG: collagen-like protein [Clostridiales bacterium]|jgi:hypothetical protein|nr:collagen-like protein [Clostridiales bacterium]
MKHHKTKITAFAAIVFTALLAFTGCAGAGLQGEKGDSGATGPAGPQGSQGADGSNATATAAAPFDYYAQSYKGVGLGSVFKTLVYHDLYHLITNPRVTPGEYIVLIGSANDTYTQGVIGVINDVAKEKGIKEILVFDPELDGGLSESIVGRIGDNAKESSNIGRIGYTLNGTDYYYDDLNISDYKWDATTTLLQQLNASLGTKKLAVDGNGKIITPQLLVITNERDAAVPETIELRAASGDSYSNVYDAKATATNYNSTLYDVLPDTYVPTVPYGTPTAGLPEGTIVSPEGIAADTQLTKTVFSKRTAAVKDSNVTSFKYDRAFLEANAYKAEIRSFFDTKVTKANLKEYDVFTVKNQAQVSGGGTTRLLDNQVFQTLTFAEVDALLQTSGEHFIYWGGLWCPNSATLYAGAQSEAQKAGYTGTVYLFDPRLVGDLGSSRIRDSESAPTSSATGNHASLYKHLIRNYFPDYTTRWNSEGTLTKKVLQRQSTASNDVLTIGGEAVTRIVVPAFFLYNKDINGGVIADFESELTWNASDNNLVSNVKDPASVANQFRTTIFGNIFAKAGFTESFQNAGYSVTVSFSGLEATLTASRSADDYVTAISYYYADAAGAATFGDGTNGGVSTTPYPFNLAAEKTALASNGVKQLNSGASNILYYGSGNALNVLTALGWTSK